MIRASSDKIVGLTAGWNCNNSISYINIGDTGCANTMNQHVKTISAPAFRQLFLKLQIRDSLQRTPPCRRVNNIFNADTEGVCHLKENL